jgi:hypothetical protein
MEIFGQNKTCIIKQMYGQIWPSIQNSCLGTIRIARQQFFGYSETCIIKLMFGQNKTMPRVQIVRLAK